jgi:crotonobetainyl-CoA:carnitine CoA-transferase CaiB-like acyl-CoA transferase
MTKSLHRKSFDPKARGALDGVRVIDLSRLVAGNMMTKVLADHGADVIKIEPPEGDTLRAWRVKGIETSWKTICRNKLSVALDMRHPDGVAAIRRLAEEADMLVESFRPGVLELMGLDPAALLAANPKLVITRISGWGQDGPYRHKPGFGTLVEGYAGFAAINGFADREPVLPPMFMGDAYAGLYGASAAMIAMYAVKAGTAQGQVIDLSLLEPLFAVLEPQIANHRVTGRLKPRTGSRSTNTAPRNAYRTADGGWVCLSASTQGMVEKLFRSLGREELITDPRFRTNPDRLANIEVLDRIVADYVATLTLEQALDHFDRTGVTIGPIMDAAQLSEDRYMREREALIEVPDEEMGWLPMHGLVPRLSGTPGVLRRPAPKLGEHTEAILRPVLGAEYDRLVADRVLRPAPARGA